MILIWYRLSNGSYAANGLIEDVLSIVWTQRYQDYGEAEIIIPLKYKVQLGDLFKISDRSMAVEVIGINENEKQITLRCKDALSILDRRILLSGVSNDGLVSTFITKVLSTVVETTGIRNLPVFRIGDLSTITARANIQRSYSHIGELLLEMGKAYNFNPIARLSSGLLYVDANVSTAQRTWGVGRYLSGYVIDKDAENFKNIVYTGGQIVNNARVVVPNISDGTLDVPTGMDRYEEWLDRRDTPFEGMSLDGVEQNYGEFTAYTTMTLSSHMENGVCTDVNISFYAWVGQIYLSGGKEFKTNVASLKNILSFSDWTAFKAIWGNSFRAEFIGFNDSQGGWVISNEDNTDSYVLTPSQVVDGMEYSFTSQLFYEDILIAKGIEEAKQHDIVNLIEIATEGMTPYQDYNLGDTINLVSDDGERYQGKVREIIESWDSHGYSVTPTVDFD